MKIGKLIKMVQTALYQDACATLFSHMYPAEPGGTNEIDRSVKRSALNLKRLVEANRNLLSSTPRTLFESGSTRLVIDGDGCLKTCSANRSGWYHRVSYPKAVALLAFWKCRDNLKRQNSLKSSVETLLTFAIDRA